MVTDEEDEKDIEESSDNYKGNIDIEKVFSGSFGIDPVLLHLREVLPTKLNKVNTILISLNTCVRNVVSNDLSEEEILLRVKHEINLILEVIIDAIGDKPYYIGFYITNHHADYPADKVRPRTPGKKKYYDTCDYLWDNFSSIELVASPKELPYVEFFKLDKPGYGGLLYDKLINLSKRLFEYTYTGYLYLISHNPLDFYLLNKAPNGFLLASHTGELLNYKDLGKKVFGNEYLPFYFSVHIIMGDKNQVKPVIRIGKRKQIRSAAEKGKWQFKNEAQIAQEIRNNGIIVT